MGQDARAWFAAQSFNGRVEEPKSAPALKPEAGTCSSCRGRGHVVERWTGTRWITVRGCGVCGMAGEPTAPEVEVLDGTLELEVTIDDRRRAHAMFARLDAAGFGVAMVGRDGLFVLVTDATREQLFACVPMWARWGAIFRFVERVRRAS